MQSVAEEGPFSGHEADDARLAAEIVRDIRTRLPFVPAYLKALAREPRALLEAWLQTRTLYDDPAARTSVSRLATAADPGLAYQAGAAVREAVRPFHDVLPTLLLAVASLRLTLDGVLERQPLPAPTFRPDTVPLVPEVSDEGEDPTLFTDIRRVYGTAHVPSMMRSLAGQSLLAEPWMAIGPYLDSEPGRRHIDEMRRLATEAALLHPGAAVLGHEAARGVVDVFWEALPRNVVFAAACYRTTSGSRDAR
jgi:hypothetical protein